MKTTAINMGNLRKIVNLSGMSRDQIAFDCGLGRSTLDQLLKGTYNPSVPVLWKLADYFNVPIDYLVGRVSDEQKDLTEQDYFLYFKERRKFSYELYKSMYQKKPAGFSLEIPEGYEALWPYNLITDIFQEDITWIVTEDQEAGIEYLLSRMTPRTKEIVYRRYRDGNTLEDISKEFKITRERVRQILARAVRIMRSPVRRRYIEDGLKGTEELNETERYISKRKAKLEQMKNQLDLEEKYLNIPEPSAYDQPVTDIFLDECAMSVRLFNCLRRSRLDTVNKIVAAVNDESILRVRNLGRKTYEELLTWLKTIGVPYDPANNVWGQMIFDKEI